MRRLVVIFTALLALSAPAPASALADPDHLDLALDIADAVYGERLCSPLKVRQVDFPGAKLGEAWLGPRPFRCVMRLDDRQWPWWKLCFTVLHESGHLVGLKHVDRPGWLMSPKAWEMPFCKSYEHRLMGGLFPGA